MSSEVGRTRDDVEVTAADLLSVRRISGPPTSERLRTNIAVSLRYFDAWLRGQGAVALYGLIERVGVVDGRQMGTGIAGQDRHSLPGPGGLSTPQKPDGGSRRPLLLSRRPCERTRRWYP